MPLRSRSPFSSLCLLVILLTGSAAKAQDPTTLRIGTRLVVLDVVVTDKQGRPVEDLSKDDFIVTEDKASQSLRTLESPSQHALPPGNLVHSTADIAKVGDAPVNILVLDELNTRFEDNATSRYELEKFLKAQPTIMPPTTLLVANDKSFAVLEDYTQTRSVLEAALKRDPVQYPWRLAQHGNSGPEAVIRLVQSLRTLEQIAQAATGTPGRKNVIWVGRGFPSVDLTGLDSSATKPLQDAVKRCVSLLLDSRVTLYIVDPTPLSSATYDAETPTDLATLEAETNTEPFGNAVRFSTLAPTTGGRVFSARNDIDREIATSIREGASYYTLSYAPTNRLDEPGQYRHVHVALKRPGLTATTRDGYYPQPHANSAAGSLDSPTTKAEQGEEVSDVASAALSKMVYNGLKVRAGKVGPGRFSLAVADSSLTWDTQLDGTANTGISIVAICFSAAGKVLAHTTQVRTLTAKHPNDTAAAEEIFTLPIVIPPGTARLRLVLRADATGHLGSADFDKP